MSDIEILKMKSVHVTCETSTILAAFDAQVGDFRIRNAQVRVSHENDMKFVSLPGRKDGGISLRYGETRRAVVDAALAHYEEHFVE